MSAHADLPDAPAMRQRAALYLVLDPDPATAQAQLAALEEFLRAQGFTLVARYLERAEDARSRRRPKLRLLLGRARTRAFDVLCVRGLTQLGRTRLSSLHVIVQLGNLGVLVQAQSEISFDPTASNIRWLEEDRSRQSDKIKRALAAKRARGERTGAVKFGFKLAPDGVHVLPDEAQQAVKVHARLLRACGMSYREIARVLNHSGGRSSVGTLLTHTQVERMLRAANET